MVMKKIYEEIGKKADYEEEIINFNNRVFNLLRELDTKLHVEDAWCGEQYDDTVYKKVANLLGDIFSKGGGLSNLARRLDDYKKALEENIIILKSTIKVLDESKPDLKETFLGWLDKELFSATPIDIGYKFRNGNIIVSIPNEFEKIVYEPYIWLKDKFPEAYENYQKALNDFTLKRNATCISHCYLALEGVVKNVLNISKASLDNESIRGQFIDKLGLTGKYKELLRGYCKAGHELARHASKEQNKTDSSIDRELVEFYLYTTGIFLRLTMQRMN
jgi:hypothetical protein